MGVYIRNMEMPKSCMACMFSRRDITNTDWCVLAEKNLPCDCPLIEVPKHGRLIDADDMASITIDCDARGNWKRINAPTIIESEE